MKIVIGVNTYKEETSFNNREQMCVDSLRVIKQKHNIELYSFTFFDEQFEINDFNNCHNLQDIPNVTNRKVPFVNEIFDKLSDIDCDYFIFVNNDVAVSNRFIKEIERNNVDCLPASKLHFTKLDSINDKESIPQSLSVHGFDGFAIRSYWWKENRIKFKPMLLGCAYWDTYFYSKCQLYGECITLNKPPAVIFHLDHQSTSMEAEPGNAFNEKNFVEDEDNINTRWFSYVQNVLLKRPTHNNILWYTPFTNEAELEKQYFTK
jgi:hypothetical protein